MTTAALTLLYAPMARFQEQHQNKKEGEFSSPSFFIGIACDKYWDSPYQVIPLPL
jgi:hypothetical protein